MCLFNYNSPLSFRDETYTMNYWFYGTHTVVLFENLCFYYTLIALT